MSQTEHDKVIAELQQQVQKLQLQVSELSQALLKSRTARFPKPASASERVRHTMKHKPHLRFDPTHAYLQAAAAARIVGNPDLIEAAKSGNIELVKDHVVADASCVLEATSRYDRLALFLALANCPSPCIFNFLISVISGYTALMLASIRGHLDIIRFLVESGAELDAKDGEYSTP